jgi:HD-like signal output (HDOD) protein
MSDTTLDEATDKIIAGIKIPPRPEVLAELMIESRLDSPDIQKIGHLISKDVALSVSMLKLVNSSYYGVKRKVESPQQAAIILGVNNVKSLVTGLSLKSAYGQVDGLEAFWSHAELVANVSMVIASRLPGVPRETAYIFGLFQNCGIPLMMQRLPGYAETLALAMAGDTVNFTEIETERHTTSHAIVGHMMAKSWELAEEICEAITHHHEAKVFDDDYQLSAAASALIAVSRLAEYVIEPERVPEGYTSEGYGLTLGDHLGFDDADIKEFMETALGGGT